LTSFVRNLTSARIPPPARVPPKRLSRTQRRGCRLLALGGGHGTI
jgi:hypothetical protein